MTNRPMSGVRIVEVAQFTFVPASGAVLADWGADVIKVEHAVRGDAQRGLKNIGFSGMADGAFHPIMEHPNRGKRSIGLALETPGGLEVLYRLVREADVFVTNFLPDARQRLGIDVEHIRAENPDIIYVRGSAFGARGPEAREGGYDFTGFWCRGGSAAGATPPDVDGVIGMPAPAYGDSIGGMTIAGGIAGALFGRERTGEPSIVDVSLLSVGAWANGLAVDLSLMADEPCLANPISANAGAATNPLTGIYRTQDDRWISMSMLQPLQYWPEVCRHLGRDEWATDERFTTFEAITANAEAARQLLADELASKPYAHWVAAFDGMEGQWAPVQNSLELGHDPQLRANGYVAPITDADGRARELVLNPVQYDETEPTIGRAPQFAEHTDDILRELGYDDDALIQLKIDGAVT